MQSMLGILMLGTPLFENELFWVLRISKTICLTTFLNSKVLRSLHTNFRVRFSIFSYPFISKCMLRMRKRRTSNLISILFCDGWTKVSEAV